MVATAGREAGEILRRHGIDAMAPELAIEALQEALRRDETTVAIADIRWETFAPIFAAARPRPLIEDLPEVRAAQQRGGPSRGGDRRELRERLADAPEEERRRMLLELVRTEVARVLGHPSSDGRGPGRGRSGSSGSTRCSRSSFATGSSGPRGLRLPATLVFDYPTAAGLADHLLGQLVEGGSPTDEFVEAELGRLEQALASQRDNATKSGVASRLRTLLADLEAAPETPENGGQVAGAVVERIQTASDEEIFSFIDRELESL